MRLQGLGVAVLSVALHGALGIQAQEVIRVGTGEPTCTEFLLESWEQLRGTELEAALDSAVSQQMRYEHVSAAFDVIYRVDQGNLALVSSAPAPHLTFNGGVVEGTTLWWRDGARQRVELRYDIPPEMIPYNYLDTTIVDDGERHIASFPRSRQVLITGSRGLLEALPVPADWLLPVGRRDFRQALARGATIEGFRSPEDAIVVRTTLSSADGPGEVIDALLAEAWDFSVVEWRCRAWSRSCEIEYERNADGQAVPKEARFYVYVSGSDSEILREWTLRTASLEFSAPTPEATEFAFEPGMVVADYYEPQDNGDPRGYSVDKNGNLVEVPMIMPIRPVTGTMGVGIAGVCVLLVGAGLALRAHIVSCRLGG